ncbi:hypothetical protein V8C86DRAFT_2641239 [Haematococcus lacustris]
MAEVPFDWCSFYALFWNDKGIRCKVNIPDTVLFRHGQLSAWWANNKEGCIQRHTSQTTSVEAIRKRFLQVANDDESNYSKFVAVSRLGDGKPQLLRVLAFNQLCELLSDRLESGHPDASPEIETPSVLQAFVQPYQDLRYVTTYINTGNTVTCHSFQRKYSRRYTPMSAASAAQIDVRDADIILAVGEDADARRAEIDNHQGAVEPGLKMQLRKLTAHIVKYIERAHGLTLGGLVCEYIRDADGKVFLMSVMRTEWTSTAGGQGAGSLASAGKQQDPVDLDFDDEQQAMAQVQAQHQQLMRATEPPSNQQAAPNFNSEWAGQRAGADPQGSQPSSHPTSSAGVASTAAAQGYYDAQGPTQPPSMQSYGQEGLEVRRSTSPRQGWSAAGSQGGQGPGGGGPGMQRSPLVQYPGGNARATGQGMVVTNTWPSQQHEAQLNPSAYPLARAHSARPLQRPQQQQQQQYMLSTELSYGAAYNHVQGPPVRVRSARPASGSSGIPRPSQYASTTGVAGLFSPQMLRARSPNTNPGGAPQGFGSTTNRSMYVSPDRPYSARGVPSLPLEFPAVAGGTPAPLVGALTARGEHVNGGSRGAPLVINHLQREVEVLRDNVVYQHELAEANAAKVRQLEREKEVVTNTFDTRRSDLEHIIATTRDDLAAARADRDDWRQRAERSEARTAELEAERTQLSNTISEDRSTTLTALKGYQEREAGYKERIAQLEAEVVRLSDGLKMETTAVNSLKRQLLDFSEIAERHKGTLRDAHSDPALLEVLDRTNHLLADQTNPTGEQYAMQKILQHYHVDLRSVFLFYTQLEHNFTDHWPPSLKFAQWMLFCKDSETSDIRAGARIRSLQHFRMLHPTDCENIFARYSQPDTNASRHGKADPVLTYEAFLSALVHVAAKLRRPEVPYLSESLREYILRYLSRASRVTPQGTAKGAVRQALEGTDRDPTSYDDSPDEASRPGTVANGRVKGKASRARSVVAANRGHQPRPMSAASLGAVRPSTARALEEAGNSAVMKELALMNLSSPTSSREVVRTGGGFQVA